MSTQPGAREHLPVADPARVRQAAVRLVRLDSRAFALMLILYALAAGAGLAAPWLLGRIIDEPPWTAWHWRSCSSRWHSSS